MSKNIKPIHKFNGGRGATLCHECNRIITEGMTEDLYCEEHGGAPSYKYKLVRTRDDLTITGSKVLWIEWNENGTFNKDHMEPTIGASLVVDPRYGTYRWLTTPMLSYTEENGVITFNTENSTYKLIKNG